VIRPEHVGSIKLASGESIYAIPPGAIKWYMTSPTDLISGVPDKFSTTVYAADAPPDFGLHVIADRFDAWIDWKYYGRRSRQRNRRAKQRRARTGRRS